MSHNPVDPKQIKKTRQKFMGLSQQRLARMLDSFNLTQADSIKLLPLLFHVNHPMLPGYVDKSTPCGLPNFTPTALEKRIAKTVSRSFKYESRAYLKFEIAGLYLMGSTGTLGQSLRSDLDLWVCLSERLGAIERTKLFKKTELISEWMATKGIELNCYLVHEQQFKFHAKKMLTTDSCGDTQNYMLLDEFYRTAVWLCGRTPLWWIVPPDENYEKYARRLIKEKHIDALDWIDFGDINRIPAGEFFSSALWQLFKAIDSPYKSSLKLMMLEKYAREFPDVPLLSRHFKQQVYSNEESIDKMDPYLTMYRSAESFLENQKERLEFLRRAFYLKAGTKVNLKKDRPKNWRYGQMKSLVTSWGWNQNQLDHLNNRSKWQIDSVLTERVDLVRELNHSYHFISNFARVQGVLNEGSQLELVSLGRMLYATFERRAGKIEKVNTGIARNVSEAAITLQRSGEHWRIFLGALRKNQLNSHSPVYTADSFFMALAWCVCNDLLTRKSTFQVYADDDFFSYNLATNIVKNLMSLMRRSKPQLGETAFHSSAKVLKLGVFLNTEFDPLQIEKDSGIYSVLNHEDGFNWGENQINLFAQFDIFWINSWGELGAKRYSGDFAWLDFFEDYREMITHQEDSIEFFAQQIPDLADHKKRIFQMLHAWNRLRLDSSRKQRANRFLMSSGNHYLRIDFFDRQIDRASFRFQKQMMSSLSEQLRDPITYHYDSNLKLPAPLLRIFTKQPDVDYQCYLLQETDLKYQILIKDPKGNLFFQMHQGANLQQLVSHYQQFYDSMSPQNSSFINELPYLLFWTTDLREGESARLKRVKVENHKLASRYMAIQAIAVRNTEGKVRYDLAMEQTLFHYRDYGELVYRKLAKLVLEQRKTQSNYPIFITNIDLSGVSQQPRVMDLLNHKRLIEQKLTKVMSQLVSNS